MSYLKWAAVGLLVAAVPASAETLSRNATFITSITRGDYTTAHAYYRPIAKMVPKVAGQSMTFSVSPDKSTIRASGKITARAPIEFHTFVISRGLAGTGATVELNSSGGSQIASVMLGMAIRHFGLSTSLSGVCYSACTFAFSGGVTRSLKHGDRFGIHQTARMIDGKMTAVQHDRFIREYLALMGVDRAMQDAADTVPFTTVRHVSLDEAERWNVVAPTRDQIARMLEEIDEFVASAYPPASQRGAE